MHVISQDRAASRTDRTPAHLSRLLIGLPLLSLALGAVAWLRYAIDMPWYDDWRGYAEGTMHSLHPRHLFRPINDTLSPVGLALDALAQRYLDGNSVAYQFLSMLVVLGSLLFLQWKLLRRALDNTVHAAICFSFTVLMLQPGSYWGLENLAYEQGLPLVFILGALWIMLEPGAHRAWRGPSVGVLGLLAGFTYVSGAFGALAAGIALLGVALLCHSGDARRELLRNASWFTATSAMAAAAQLYFLLPKFRTEAVGIPLALPSESRFWAFYLGKLGRSLLLPTEWPWASLGATLVICAIAVAAAVLLVRRAARSGEGAEATRVALVCIPLAALVFVYLMLVAAGRTNFRPPEMQGHIEIFLHGFTRFHFFWAALIWPWVVAAVISLGRQKPWFDGAAFQRAGMLFAGLAAALVFAGGGYSHMASQRELAGKREAVANCLLKELQRGGEVRCEGLLPPRREEPAPDAYPAYVYARKTGASFVRNFPVLTGGKRRESIPAFLRMDPGTAKLRMRGMEALGKGSFRATGDDPQLFIQTQLPQYTQRCWTLDLEIDMKVAKRDTAKLYFRGLGEPNEYSEAHSIHATVGAEPGMPQTLTFRLRSDTGIFESFRFDPVTKPQTLEIGEIRAYCVWDLP